MLAVGALLLSGCVPEPEPVATPSVEPEPTATVEAATRPNSVFALGCADVLTLDEVQSRVAAPIVVKRDETNVPGDIAEVAALQRGGLSCKWGTGGTWEDDVELLFLPDAAAFFAEKATDGFAEEMSITGADSAIGNCWFGRDIEGGVAPGGCTITALVGTSAVEFSFVDSQGAYATEAGIGIVAAELLERAIAHVVTAGMQEQLWSPPPRSAIDLCGTVGSALLARLALPDLAGGEVEISIESATSCAYANPSLHSYPVVAVTALHSAAWAVGVAQTESPWLGDPWQERRTAHGVLWWLSPDGPEVSARVAIEGDLVHLSISSYELDMTVEAAAEVLTDVVERYAEAPPGT